MNAITPDRSPAPLTNAPDDLPDGIYFGLPDDRYHALPRLSASGIKDMLISPLEFWWRSPLNPDRDADDTDSKAKILGRAYHKLILEGEAAFDAAYTIKPDRADHPDALAGADALRQACGDHGLKRSGSIAEMCERLRDAVPDIKLWPDIIAGWETANMGKEPLSAADWKNLNRVRLVLRRMPSLQSAFTGGKAEVSVLWTDRGVPCKARFDYLKPRDGEAGIIDLKSFANVMTRPIDEVAATEISRNRYFAQAVFYDRARSAAARMWARDGMACVNGCTDADTDWLRGVFGPAKASFHFVFVATGSVPHIVARKFEEFMQLPGMMQPHEYWRRGTGEVRYALHTWRKFMDKYGAGLPWIVEHEIRSLHDEDFPIYALSSHAPFVPDEESGL